MAVALVEIDENEKFTINQEGLAVLEKIPGKVAVFMMTGLYRTGKSSLLNWILEDDSEEGGFKVASTVERCTRGIWLWKNPKSFSSKDDEVWTVIMDTEGLGSLKTNGEYDNRLFSLATLLCSKLIYNSLGGIDENAISNLSFIAGLSKHIANDQHSNPSFMWIVRDFSLELLDEGGSAISSNDYLENSLAIQSVALNAESAKRNQTREIFTSYFTKRECYTMVRPIVEEEALQSVHDIPVSKLRAQFIQQIAELKKKLFSNVQPKRINGQPLTGVMLTDLLASYVDMMNNGSVPNIANAWSNVVDKGCQNAADHAYSQFCSTVNDGFSTLPTKESELIIILQNHRQDALETYKREAAALSAGTLVDTKVAYNALQTKLNDNITAMVDDNAECSGKLALGHIEELFKQHIEPLFGDDPVKDLYTNMVHTWNQKVLPSYTSKAKGPRKYSILTEFIHGTLFDALQQAFAKHETSQGQVASSLTLEIATLQEQLSASTSTAETLQKQLDTLIEERSTLSLQLATAESESKTLASEMSTLKQDTSNQIGQLERDKVRLTAEIGENKQEIQKTEKTLDQLREEMENLHEETSRKPNSCACVIC